MASAGLPELSCCSPLTYCESRNELDEDRRLVLLGGAGAVLPRLFVERRICTARLEDLLRLLLLLEAGPPNVLSLRSCTGSETEIG